MKKILTILSATFLILIAINVNAQDEQLPVRSYLTLLFGSSSPIGNFGASAYNNNSAGYAKKGVVFGFDGAIHLYKSLSLGYNLTYQDQGELSQNDVNNLANAYNADFVKDITTVTSNDRFTSFNFMLGPQYSYSYKKFTLDVRGSIGFLKNTGTPSLLINFDNTTNNPINQQSSTSSTFAYGLSGGVRWSFSDNWDLGIKENFIGTDGVKIDNTNNTGSIGRYQTKLPISVLQTSLGITLRF